MWGQPPSAVRRAKVDWFCRHRLEGHRKNGSRTDILTTVNLPATPSPMTTTSLDRTLHAIADPTRRRILVALKQRGAGSTSTPSEGKNGLCAGDIEERVRLSQPTISHHMSILTKAGLVDAVKQGQWRWYRRNEKALRRLVKSLRTQL